MRPKQSIAILGAGSWGTAVAVSLARSHFTVYLWSHNHDHVQNMLKKRCNERYLADISFPETLIPTGDLQRCVSEADLVIIAVPSHAFAPLLNALPQPKNGLAWLTKGIDPSSQQLLSTLVSQQWGADYPIAMITGPSFAREVAKDLPTALVLASNNTHFQHQIREVLHIGHTRVYLSDDVTGVQLCGAVKNVLAIACGISDGIGYGANAKAALITRGLAEMRRLLTAYHAKTETCLGLAGVGDLVLTCTDNQSRNRRFGLLLGQGVDATIAEQQINQVVEGKHNASQICTLATIHQIDMPICQAVQAVLSHQLTPQKAVQLLMSRPPKEE